MVNDKKNNEYNIVYTPRSDNYLNTIVSIKSVLLNNLNNRINFHIFIDEYFDDMYLKYFNIFKSEPNCQSINIIKFNSLKYKISNKIYYSNRFVIFDIHNYISCEKVLFLNSYSIVNSDLSELFNINLENYSCAAAEYIYPNTVNVDNRVSIFDDTVLLINIQKWTEKDYFDRYCHVALDWNNNEKKGIELFNTVIDNFKIIDSKYNYTEAWLPSKTPISCGNDAKQSYIRYQSHLSTPTIISFIMFEPLKNFCKNSYVNLWWRYAQQTPIYDKIKEIRQLNKYKLSSTSAQNSFKYSWLLSRIWPYIKPYWFRILLGFAIAIPLGLLDGVTAFALKPYMDYVIGGKNFVFNFHGVDVSMTSIQMAYIIPVCVVLFAAIQGVLRYLNEYLSAWTSAHITNNVKLDLFHKLIHMHPQFFDENSSGIVLSRYMGDPKTASAGIVDNIKTITTSLCGALGLIAVMIYSSWQLAFIGILVLCVAFVPVALIRKRIRETSNKNMVIGGKITTNINETYSGNKVMAAYGLQDRQESYFRDKVWESYDVGMSLLKRAGWMSPMMYLIASFGIAIVLGAGTYLINSGQMTAGSFASFVTSLLLLYKPVKTLGGTLTGIQGIFVAMGRVFELFDLDSAIKECENPKELKGLDSSIDFENVNFEYVPNNPVLKNLNLHINKNETLAIVGNSGGGKSTLVNLLPRFYDIKSGAIKFDGVDIKEFSLDSLRKNISMVFQDNFLFSGTIKENILMGNPDATIEELTKAIKSAHLEDTIEELPEGLETELGERGLTLSGGQRQRVAIARAMLRNAPIVILDEATSALDNESEAIVQKAMDNLMQNRTVFIIAHRLSTIKNADRIAVINEGELVELGTHEELMNIDNGQYKALYEMQFKKREYQAI